MLTTLEENNVNVIYNNIADHFNVTRVNKWHWVENFLNNLKEGTLVLDIGCGNGRNMNHKNLNFIGIDNCENFVKICKEKIKCIKL